MSPGKSLMSNIKHVVEHPELLTREFKDAILPIKLFLHRTIDSDRFVEEYGNGIDVMREDWDNLIILDACRYDAFEETNNIEGDLKSVTSSGSHSTDFIKENFFGGEYHDTIYVSANTHAEKIDDGIFFKVDKTYSDSQITNSIEKNKKRDPELVHDLALENNDQHPNKRLIVHFMQPHSPYIGPRAEEVRTNLLKKEGLKLRYWCDPEEIDVSENIHYNDLLQAARAGHISDEVLWEIYVENLTIGLDWAEELISTLDGKSVITADHGELLGDASSIIKPDTYFHYNDLYIPELRIVPWLEVESESRREIQSEEPIGVEDVDDEVVSEQLEALGYV